jgi:hypothetical protein
VRRGSWCLRLSPPLPPTRKPQWWRRSGHQSIDESSPLLKTERATLRFEAIGGDKVGLTRRRSITDYETVIAQAVEGLDQNTSRARHAPYERPRSAQVTYLRAVATFNCNNVSRRVTVLRATRSMHAQLR